MGGPAVEASRGNIKLTAPLAGITAAVVGVIVSLAVFFARHVLWPRGTDAEPFAGGFDAFSLLLMVAASIGLWRLKLGVVQVIGASAAAGLLFSLLVR